MRMAANERFEYRFKELEKVDPLAQALAAHFPDPASVTTAIYELLVNAVEHGNLGIGFARKSQLLKEGKWQQEITRRQRMLPYAAREASVTLEYGEYGWVLCVTDQGEGFDWQQYCLRAEGLALPHGRGLQIVLHSGFDEVLFNASGNQVTCIKQPLRAPQSPRGSSRAAGRP